MIDVNDRERTRRARQSQPSLMQARELRALLGGVSDMWLWRHRHEMPQPVTIGKRRFWRCDEIHTYIEGISAARVSEAA